MADKGGGAINRKDKFAPDPSTPLEVALEQNKLLANEVKLLRQNMQTTTLHAFDRAPYIDPTQGEVLWDFQFQRGYIFHHEMWRPLAPPTYHIKVFPDDKDVTSEKPFTFGISRDMGGWTPDTGEPYPSFYLYDAEAYLSTGGSCTVSLHNVTAGNSMLSSPLVISGNWDTGTRVIHPVNSVVSWHDLIRIEVDSPGGKGLGVLLVFNPFID